MLAIGFMPKEQPVDVGDGIKVVFVTTKISLVNPLNRPIKPEELCPI
jgi:hypothetical protein